jgi:diaminopimelate decarboxylase
MEALARLYGAKVYLEPGRYLVAEAGVLVARIWGIKETRRRYLLLDAGMTSLLRPALYGARHPVEAKEGAALEGAALGGDADEAHGSIKAGKIPVWRWQAWSSPPKA